MNGTVGLLVSLALIALIIIAALLWRRRLSPPTPQNPNANPIIDADLQQTRDGTTVAVPREQTTRRERWQTLQRSSWSPWLAALGAVLLLAVGYWAYGQWFGVSRPDQFVVVVAPFRDTGGDVSQTGRAVADELATTLAGLPTTNGSKIVVEEVGEAPTNGSDAYDLASRSDADIVIWGEVSPGGVLDQETLLPQIAYAPSGAYAPNAWDGYLGRFTMPGNFIVASAPVNGRVVMPALVMALADYANGDADATFDLLGRLAENYPAIQPTLIHSFRGNILWARGAFEQAASEYEAALSVAADDAARLENNLSAIHIDARDGQELTAMDRALQGLQEAKSDMGELRFNLALVALEQGRAADAVAGLTAARDGLLPPSVPLLLTLARAQREAGEFDAAEAALATAQQQSDTDLLGVPSGLRSVVREWQRASILQEQGLLGLARLADGKGPLMWELEAMPIRPSSAVQPARTTLEAALTATNNVVSSWRSSETTDAARNRPGASLIDNGQARRAEQTSDRRQLLVAMARLEEAREGLTRDPGFWGSLFGGLIQGSTSISSVESLLKARVVAEPENIDGLLLYARALRLRRDFAGANEQYNRVTTVASQRPEGFYGKGMVALDQNNISEAKGQLNQALERNQDFFPARQALARIAIDAKDWPAAIDELTWLADSRGLPQDEIALAQAFRLSGAPGYQEAFAVLQPLADTSIDPEVRAEALIELGRLYNDSGNRDAARTAYEDAVKANPRSSPALFELGQTLALQEDYAGAEERMLAAIDADQTNIDARLALAELYIGPLNRPEAAADMYSSLIKQGVSNVDTLTKMGDELLARGRSSEAIAAYSEALERTPDDRLLHHKIGQAYIAQKNWGAARDSEQRALDLSDGNFPEALTGLGDVARENGNFDQALNYYNQALSQNGNLVDAWLGLGQSNAAQGNWPTALGQFQDAANRAPDNAMAQFWVAEGQLRQGNLSAAIQAYNRAIGNKPDFPEAYLGLAQAQLGNDPDRTNGITAAMTTIEEALKQRPRYAEALLFKGKLLQEQSASAATPEEARAKTDEALRAYGDSINASNVLAEPYYRRGLIYLQRSDYGQAESDLQSAIDRQGNFAEAHYWLGRTYYAQSRLPAALESFKTAVSIQGGNYAEARLYQGMVEEQMGDQGAAIASFQSVLQLDANSQWASAAQQELDRLQPQPAVGSS